MPEETPVNLNGVEVKPAAAPTPWFIDEERAGEGERPSWLSDKFKTAADMAKSYSELEKKFSTPPDEYDLTKSKFIDADYEPFQEFAKYAKDKRVPADVVDKMLETYDKYFDEFTTDYSEETKKLGDNAKERLTTLDNWAKANLSEGSYEALTSNLRSADSIRALEELRGKMMNSNTIIPAGNDDGKSAQATFDEIKGELNDPANLKKFKEDPKYQKDWRSRLEMASKNSGFIDKVGA